MAKLKTSVKSLDSVAEELRGFYVEQDDEFVLDLDGSEDKKKLDEFRTNNRDLAKKLAAANKATEQLEKLQKDFKAYDGIDPKKAREALDKMEKINEDKLIGEGKFEELFQQRTDRMQRDYKAQIEALTTTLENEKKVSKKLRGNLSNHLINDALQRSVTEVAIPRQGSMRDILARGREVWTLNEESNKPEPRDANGDIIYGKEPNKPMDMKEWAESLASEAPFLFEGSQGGGAGGSRRKVEGEREVSREDSQAISQNIKEIASGKVRVV